MTVSVSLHPWSAEALFAKALLYVDRMESYTSDDEQFALWSALSLELLARAALAHISPVLLAGSGQDGWRNLSYALGRDPTVKKFSPNSIPTKEVWTRLSELVPSFTEEVASFCVQHINRRNVELHTGDLAFSYSGTSQWLPRFYQACSALLVSMNKELQDFVADPAAVEVMLSSLEDATAKAVEQDIKAHRKVWENKSPEEKESASLQATATATRQTGHRVACPSCGSRALVQGEPAGPVATSFRDDEVVQRQTILPSSFSCIACRLSISGLSRLSACGLGDTFISTSTYYAAEFFGLYTQDELEEARREGPDSEDFNEY